MSELDPYGILGREMRQAEAESDYIGGRESDVRIALTDAKDRHAFMVDGGPWTSHGTKTITVARDFGAWLTQRKDADGDIAVLLDGFPAALVDEYARERANADLEQQQGLAQAEAEHYAEQNAEWERELRAADRLERRYAR